ncbi:MAG: PorP/SprF family type IX secretion system membrane protein [Rufibacter sp.]
MLIGFLLLLAIPCSAQESLSTQQYAHRLFLNPAFTGLLSDYSLTAGHRSQWTNANNGFSTQWLGAEYRFKENRNGIGLTFISDRAPTGGYDRLQIGAAYAYHAQLRQKLNLSVGLQTTYGTVKPSTNLIFEDQLGHDGTISQPTAEPISRERNAYFSVGTGFLLFTNQFWLGASAQHLNKPALGQNSSNRLATVLQAHTGYKFYVKHYFVQNSFKEVSFIPTISYTQQRSFSQADAALYAVMTPITVGLVYSHLPGEKKLPAASTISGIAGVTHKGFKIGYSYRHPLSADHFSLGPAHEVTLSFESVDYLKIFKRSGTEKNYNRIACPAF